MLRGGHFLSVFPAKSAHFATGTQANFAIFRKRLIEGDKSLFEQWIPPHFKLTDKKGETQPGKCHFVPHQIAF
jgi:hypothetical protein